MATGKGASCVVEDRRSGCGSSPEATFCRAGPVPSPRRQVSAVEPRKGHRRTGVGRQGGGPRSPAGMKNFPQSPDFHAVPCPCPSMCEVWLSFPQEHPPHTHLLRVCRDVSSLPERGEGTWALAALQPDFPRAPAKPPGCPMSSERPWSIVYLLEPFQGPRSEPGFSAPLPHWVLTGQAGRVPAP